MKKRMISVLTVMLMAIVCTCGCKNSSDGQSSGNVQEVQQAGARPVDSMEGTGVVVGIGSDPTSLAPWVANNIGRIGILPSIYQTLVQTEGVGTEMVGVLAKSWEQVDEVTYNVTIYDYIYDTEGNHLTADDIVFSYNTAKEMGNLNKLSQIKEVKAVDEYTAQFVFTTELNAGQLETLWSEAMIVSEAAYKASPDGMATTPVGTGPYKFEEYVLGARVMLTKSDKYWQTDEALILQMHKANVDNIEFDIITDLSQMATALKTGSIDMTNTVDSVDLGAFKENGDYAEDFQVFQFQATNTYMLEFNCSEKSVCSNLNLRKAIAYAIDADQIVEAALKGEGFKVHGYGNSIYGDYNEAWDKEDYFEYDLDKAKEYLAAFEEETGKKVSEITLNFVLKEGIRPNDEDVMQIVQGYLMALGLNVNISVEAANNYVSFAADPTAWDLTIACENAASTNYLITWWENQMNPSYYESGRGTFNFITDDTLTELLYEAKSPEGHTSENMDKLQNYINDNVYYYGLCGYYENVVASKKVTSLYTECRVQILPGGCEYDWER